MVDTRRRLLLRGKFAAAGGTVPSVPLRPPWAIADDARFTARCTRCGDCVPACPQHVLHIGDGGYPEIRFDARGCTFCGACVSACAPHALVRVDGQLPWTLKARIDSHCLAQRKVECRVCGEACQARAISFRPVPGGVALPEFDPARCTGCGDCVRPCPVSAVSMQPAQAGHAHQR